MAFGFEHLKVKKNALRTGQLAIITVGTYCMTTIKTIVADYAHSSCTKTSSDLCTILQHTIADKVMKFKS